MISWQPELTICLSSNLMFAKLKRGTSAMFAVVLYSSGLRLFLLFKYKKIMFCFMHIHQQKFFFSPGFSKTSVVSISCTLYTSLSPSEQRHNTPQPPN